MLPTQFGSAASQQDQSSMAAAHSATRRKVDESEFSSAGKSARSDREALQAAIESMRQPVQYKQAEQSTPSDESDDEEDDTKAEDDTAAGNSDTSSLGRQLGLPLTHEIELSGHSKVWL